MGEVFLATDGPRVPESLVAVKAIRREVAGDPAFRARFRREIAVAESVASPFVARLVAGDADAEQPWLATEYVPGPTLAEAVRPARAAARARRPRARRRDGPGAVRGARRGRPAPGPEAA